jgi:hypothetical protein
MKAAFKIRASSLIRISTLVIRHFFAFFALFATNPFFTNLFLNPMTYTILR